MKHRARTRDQLIVGLLIGGSLAILAGIGYWFLPRTSLLRSAQFQPRSVSLSAGVDSQLITTDCFAAVLPNDFAVTQPFSCAMNAYARPRKYQYINVEPYREVTSLVEAEARWRQRWVQLGAEVVERKEVTWAGLPALRLVEKYPQNNEAFVSYVVFLTRPLPIAGSAEIRAFELRGWGTTVADQALVDQTVTDWQWRF